MARLDPLTWPSVFRAPTGGAQQRYKLERSWLKKAALLATPGAMRTKLLTVFLVAAVAACGGGSVNIDGGTGGGEGGGEGGGTGAGGGIGGGGGDSGTGGGTGGEDAGEDDAGFVDFDGGNSPAEIAAVRAALNPEDGGVNITDGGLSLPIDGAIITRVKPLVGVDPAGFFVQGSQGGPAVFIAVDPATITPTPAVGDQVTLAVRSKAVVSGLVRVTEIANYTRGATSVSISPLVQDVNNVDLKTELNEYESEIISLSGTVSSPFGGAGADHASARITTAGQTDGGASLRLPVALVDELDLGESCAITVPGAIMWRFFANPQPSVWSSADVNVTSCPSPGVLSATADSYNSVVVRFDRKIDPASVVAGGSQFTFDNSLTASSVFADGGREITVGTSGQDGGATYSVTVANTITDTRGTALDSNRDTANFFGFEPPAVLQITEVNPAVADFRDLVELKVLSGGTTANFLLVQDETTVLATLPRVSVATGDVIVVHLGTVSTDAPGSVTSETTSKTQFLKAANANNYDTAWDFYNTPTSGGGAVHITFSNRVVAIRDANNVTQDAVVGVTQNSTVGSFLATLRAYQLAGHWKPSDCGGAPCTYASNPTAKTISVDWTAVTNSTDSSIVRAGSTDTDTNADWSVSTVATFGL